jgi:transcriptional/translational regulatory protein YebC/TACO1
LRRIFAEHGGKLGESGSAQWMFTRRATPDGGIEYVPKTPYIISDKNVVNQLQALFDALDNHQDVKEIYSNAQFSS